MKTIQSFTVDHDQLQIGMYVSRVDGDVITYDLRMVIPNRGHYLSTGSMHTIEHLFATYVRNSKWSDFIIYVGPMGCRTGFYFLTRNTISAQQAIDLVQETFHFIADFEGEIPGNQRMECGNYLDHDLAQAKQDVCPFLKSIQNYTVDQLQY